MSCQIHRREVLLQAIDPSETHRDSVIGLCPGSQDIENKQCAKWTVVWPRWHPGDRQSSTLYTCWYNTAKSSGLSEVLTMAKAPSIKNRSTIGSSHNTINIRSRNRPFMELSCSTPAAVLAFTEILKVMLVCAICKALQFHFQTTAKSLFEVGGWWTVLWHFQWNLWSSQACLWINAIFLWTWTDLSP